MIVLGIETSTARSSVALLADGEVVAHEHHEDARGHGAFLAPAIRRCLDAAPRRDDRPHVDLVAVGTGPGLYTGLRVGMATGAAFASAREVPVVGVSGMDALAGASGVTDAPVVTTLDARRGQVFWAVHVPQDGVLVRVEGPQVGTREELDSVLAALDTVRVAGSVRVVGEIAAAQVMRPDAAAIARLGAAQFRATPEHLRMQVPLEPVYLRDADVRIGWDERGGRRGGAA